MRESTWFTPARSGSVTSHSEEALIFRERDFWGATHFGPDEDGFEVLVMPDAAVAMQRGTEASAPNEAFGILMGRVYRDRTGPYTLVTGAVYGMPTSHSPVRVNLSDVAMMQLRRQAVRQFPAAEEVGWTHSHPSPSGYSSVDLNEQKTWPGANDIGIVTYMTLRPGEPWGQAYRGPTSINLRMSRRSRSSGRMPTQSSRQIRDEATVPARRIRVINGTRQDLTPKGSTRVHLLPPAHRRRMDGVQLGLVTIAIVLAFMFGGILMQLRDVTDALNSYAESNAARIELLEARVDGLTSVGRELPPIIGPMP